MVSEPFPGSNGRIDEITRREVAAMIIESEKRQNAKIEGWMQEMQQLLAEMRNLLSHSSKGKEKVGKEGTETGSIPRDQRSEEMTWGSATRLEFPKFEGEGLDGWLLRAEYFFATGMITPESRVKVAALHLEGRAFQWHQEYVKMKGAVAYENWEEYVKVMEARFGNLAFEDPKAEFVELFQVDNAPEFVESVALPSQALPDTPPEHIAIRNTEDATVILFGPSSPSVTYFLNYNSELVLTSNVPDIMVVPPDDDFLNHVIDTMALCVLDGGCAFEQPIMKRGRGNPVFNFLFELGSKKHAYYVWRLYFFAPEDTLQKWQTETFIMVFDRGKSIPPSLPTSRSPEHEKE